MKLGDSFGKMENLLKWMDVSVESNPEISEVKPIEHYEEEVRRRRRMSQEIRIITLGYTTVGKSYYLASIFDLKKGTDPNRFNLQPEDYTKVNNIEQIKAIISDGKEGNVDTTVELTHTPMFFQKSFDQRLFKIILTDVEGQAIEAGRNPEVAKNIIEYIRECDGIILMLKAPCNPKEANDCENQLVQLFNFSGELLRKKKGNVPLCLVFNQIDALPKVKGILEKAEVRTDLFRTDVSGRAHTMAQRKQNDRKRGEILSELLKKALDSSEIYNVIDLFQSWVKAAKFRFPSRIFFTTSIGFDNTKENPIDPNTLIAKEFIQPFGTVASFLWAIYAILKTDTDMTHRLGLEENIVSQLLDDIRNLHTKGDAYFNNDDEFWAIRNLSNLYIQNYGG